MGIVNSIGSQRQQENEDIHYSLIVYQAVRMARWPKLHFWVAFMVIVGISCIGFALGGFSISQSGGWQSRGTLIADRQTQLLMVTEHGDLLHQGSV
jgi:hypothetical protein